LPGHVFQRHAGREPAKPPAHFTKAEHSQLAHDVLQYLALGGFPEVQGLDTRTHAVRLITYVDVVLLRDVLARHNLCQPQVLRWLAQLLLGNAASSFSINKFHADLRSRGVPIGKDTRHHMLAHLEDAFLLHSVGYALTPNGYDLDFLANWPHGQPDHPHARCLLVALLTPSPRLSENYHNHLLCSIHKYKRGQCAMRIGDGYNKAPL
jgi:hypothetical protein